MPQLTVSDILEDARKRAGLSEDGAVLLRWANYGYQKRNRKVAQVHPDYFLTSSSLAVVAGTDIYNLPADFLRSLRIEDAEGNTFDRIDPNDPEKPDGWYFYGQVISGGVRYERIRLQVGGGKPTSTATWTLHYVFQPPDLDETTNTISFWPAGLQEIHVYDILMRWMDTDEQSDRMGTYRKELKDLEDEFWDILGDRSAGDADSIERRHPEDMD